jgi:fumarate reductase flavoprotein subunit
MHSQCCKNMGPPTNLWSQKWFDEEVKKENSNIKVGKTYEELAKKMGVPVKAFVASVTRYNELAHMGKDLDFGKHQDRLTPIDKPPYYATNMHAVYLVIMGGLRINTNLQVLDKDRKAIPGLYAAGNVSGSFFGGGGYSTTTPGVTHSRAWTFGRLAGQHAAAEKVK